MSNLLNISSSPHVRDKSSTKSIMWDVFLALMPATAVGIFNFGLKSTKQYTSAGYMKETSMAGWFVPECNSCNP